MGNTYYEDFAVDYKVGRRWVEYADHSRHMGRTGDQVPPAWDGWLKSQYHEAPSQGNHFVDHFYQLKSKGSNHVATSASTVPPGYPSIFNKQDPNEFFEGQRERKYRVWDTMKGEKLKVD